MGEYQKFIANDEDLANTFAAVKDDQSWLDGSWSSISGGGQTIEKLTEKHIQSLFIREKFRKAEREIISLPESVVTVQDMWEKYILVTSVFKKAVKKKK